MKCTNSKFNIIVGLLPLILLFISTQTFAQVKVKQILPEPGERPGKAQLQQIQRKYGMFIHFGINTFVDQEWTDGSLPAATYRPQQIDAEQWVKVARDAGMKYVILITKHHDGFCLWDSKLTDYDVAASGNPTNVVEEVAKACKKYNIGLGLYYSLWDRHQDLQTKDIAKNDAGMGDPQSDMRYNDYMIAQLKELMDITSRHTSLVEFWFDGGWMKSVNRWPINAIYQTIKSKEKNCQVGINWTIGRPDNPDFHLVYSELQREGYPFRYFPSDFRLGDPYLPAANDPKLFRHDGKLYYLPWESTICLTDKWFFNTKDKNYKGIPYLLETYKKATANDNILIINSPPATDGRIREKDAEVLKDLRQYIDGLKVL